MTLAGNNLPGRLGDPEMDLRSDHAAIRRCSEFSLHWRLGPCPRLLRGASRSSAIEEVVHTSTALALTTPLPCRAIPLLEYLTRDSGWGRSTPTPVV